MAQERIVSGHADNSTARPITSTKESQVSDAIIVNFSEDARPSQPHRSVESIEQSETMDTGNPPDPMSFKGKFYQNCLNLHHLLLLYFLKLIMWQFNMNWNMQQYPVVVAVK